MVRSLSADPPAIAPVYLYDERGAELFDRITELDEYYPTRTEIEILRADMPAIARALGPWCMVIEPGSGSGLKTAMLLDGLDDPTAYVPIDITMEFLAQAAERHAEAHPGLEVLPVCADFTLEHPLPEPRGRVERRVVFFPGSTVGNIDPLPRERLLGRFRDVVGAGGAALIGYDLVKDPALLEAAYNDREGVTADFNKNLLRRLNREVGAGFDEGGFEFRATWNAAESRVESDLICTRAHDVSVRGRAFRFEPGDRIRTEHSYKFTLDGIADEARRAGFRVELSWLDERHWFAVCLLTAVA